MSIWSGLGLWLLFIIRMTIEFSGLGGSISMIFMIDVKLIYYEDIFGVSLGYQTPYGDMLFLLCLLFHLLLISRNVPYIVRRINHLDLLYGNLI